MSRRSAKRITSETASSEESEPGIRTAPRQNTNLATTVTMVDGDKVRVEDAVVTSVSRNGVGFSIGRSCKIGRLVELRMEMPEAFKAYQHSEPFYDVIGLVQHCNRVNDSSDKNYHVGVALIGKHAPDSYHEDPLNNYRISGMAEDGFWTVTESVSQFTERRSPRFFIPLKVGITTINRDRRQIQKYSVMTHDISAGGSSILCALDVGIGDKVKFACKSYDFYAIAVVRNRRIVEGVPSTIHLEFVEHRFPVERLPNLREFRKKAQVIALPEGGAKADPQTVFDDAYSPSDDRQMNDVRAEAIDQNYPNAAEMDGNGPTPAVEEYPAQTTPMPPVDGSGNIEVERFTN